MDIRSSLDGLRTLLGVTPTATSGTQSAKPGQREVISADHATVSSAASEVALSATEPGVRAEKVASIQAALRAGTYDVPASAVAAKMVDSMLERGQ